MEIPLAIIVLGAVALYGIVFMFVVSKIAGREQDRFKFLTKIHRRDRDYQSHDAPLAPQRHKIVVLGTPEEEEAKDRDKKVS